METGTYIALATGAIIALLIKLPEILSIFQKNREKHSQQLAAQRKANER